MNPTTTPLNSVNVGTLAAPVWQNNGINTQVAPTQSVPLPNVNSVPYSQVTAGNPLAMPASVQANVNVNQPVPVTNLNQQAMNVPQQQVPTAANAIMGATDALSAQQQQQALLQQQAQQQATQQADTKQSKSLLDNVYGQLMGFGNRQEQIYQNAGIDQKQQQVTQYSNELNAEKASAAQQIASLQNNAALNGMSSGALSGQIQRIQNESAIKQSITAVTLSALSGDLQGAQAAADRRIKLELEPLQTRLEYAKQLYADNKDSLNKTEDRQWQIQINSLNKKLDQEYAEKQKMADLIINSGAPASVLQKAQQETSLTGVARALGQYNPANLDRQVKLANIAQSNASANASNASAAKTRAETTQAVSPAQKAATAQQAAANIIDNTNSIFSNKKGLNASVTSTGLTTGGLFNPGAKASFIADVAQLTSQLTLNNLINAKANGATFGALSEGELKILSQGATKIDSWASKDKDGNVKGYLVDKKTFNKEIDRISNFAKKDYILKGGDPNTVGVVKQPDNTYWTQNSDGSFTEIQ